ncbi:hypothetical protein BT69DRAFT_1348629 [Atractiella rhizophila]|nr:hypothetical protein BT69DRAFT_1348629 [Atractiella rhizophila]
MLKLFVLLLLIHLAASLPLATLNSNPSNIAIKRDVETTACAEGTNCNWGGLMYKGWAVKRSSAPPSSSSSTADATGQDEGECAEGTNCNWWRPLYRGWKRSLLDQLVNPKPSSSSSPTTTTTTSSSSSANANPPSTSSTTESGDDGDAVCAQDTNCNWWRQMYRGWIRTMKRSSVLDSLLNPNSSSSDSKSNSDDDDDDGWERWCGGLHGRDKL